MVYLKPLTNDPVKAIFPIPQELGEAVVSAEGHSYNRAPANSKEYWEFVDKHGVYFAHYPIKVVFCQEHGQYEALPYENYNGGMLAYWYQVGKHPKFSFYRLITQRLRWTRSRIGVEADHLKEALKFCTNEDDFIEKLRELTAPNDIVTVTANGQRFRVTRAFRERYRNKEFTVNDFVSESNQDRRRLMIHSRAFAIEDVIKHMEVVAQDEEGEILRSTVTGRWSWQTIQQNYLHVVCPSTGEHYLLGIPSHIRTPKQARRWSFGLPADAEFVVEA